MSFNQLVQNLELLVNGSVIPLLFALAFIFFLINIVRFFFIDTSEEGREKGKKALLWGLIALVGLFCVWGIVDFLLNTVNTLISNNPGTPSNTSTQTQTPAQTTTPTPTPTPGQATPATPAPSQVPGQPLVPQFPVTTQ